MPKEDKRQLYHPVLMNKIHWVNKPRHSPKQTNPALRNLGAKVG